MAPRRCVLALLAVLLCLTTTGCWDRRELEEIGLVLLLGVDAAPGNQFVVTALIAVPSAEEAGGGGGGGGGQTHQVTSVQAPDVASALNLLASYVDRRPMLSHCKAVMIGEDLARRGVAPLVAQLVRFRQVRRSIDMFVVRGQAAGFLSNIKPKMEKDPRRYVENMTLLSRDTGLLPRRQTLHQFLTRLESPAGGPVAYYAVLRQQEGGQPGTQNRREAGSEPKGGAEQGPPRGAAVRGSLPGQRPMPPTPQFVGGQEPRQGGPNISLLGAAVFRRDREVGVMTGEETRIYNMLRSEFHGAMFSMPDPKTPGRYVTLDLRRGGPTRIRASAPGGRVQLDVDVNLEAELTSLGGPVNYALPENRRVLEQGLISLLHQETSVLITKAQRTWRSDIFGLGDKAAVLFPTWEQWQAYRWNQQWPNARVNVRYRVHVRRYGNLIGQPAPG